MRGTRRLRTALVRTYFSADPRSLAVGRVCLALVLLGDLGQRFGGLEAWYTNQGLLPIEADAQHAFSLFHLAAGRWLALLGFLVSAIAYTMLLVGYRTRVAQIVSFVCVLSLHGRVVFLQNAGDIVLGQLAFWTMFLPTGRRFSVDALLSRVATLNQPSAATDDEQRFDVTPVLSLAVPALLLQLALIHYFNAVQRSGATWRAGTALHYLLHQDRIVTALGLRMRHHLDTINGRALAWAALSIEAFAPLLILSPILRRHSRHAAIVLLLLLHLFMALVLRTGVYAAAMIAFLAHLIPSEDWDALDRWWERRPLQRIVVYDGDCGVCLWLMRIFSRLDRARHLRFSANDVEPLPPGVNRELVQRTLLVFDPTTGRRWIRSDAVAEVFRVLPGGTPVAFLMRLPGVRRFAHWAYDRFAVRRSDISRALGLAACGVPMRLPAQTSPSTRPALSPRVLRALPRVREGLVAAAMMLALSQLVSDDRAVPNGMGVQPRGWTNALAANLQLFQGWASFAPDPPLGDMNLVVDAVTVDGRHVDPFNQVASPRNPAPGLVVTPALGQDVLFATYVGRIAAAAVHHPALIAWLRRHPQRTGRPEQDRLVSIQVYVVEDDSPLPGDAHPHRTRVSRLISWRE